mgnify:CR=1 FL=1
MLTAARVQMPDRDQAGSCRPPPDTWRPPKSPTHLNRLPTDRPPPYIDPTSRSTQTPTSGPRQIDPAGVPRHIQPQSRCKGRRLRYAEVRRATTERREPIVPSEHKLTLALPFNCSPPLVATAARIRQCCPRAPATAALNNLTADGRQGPQLLTHHIPSVKFS